MNIVKAVALLIAVSVLAVPGLAQQVQLQSAMEIDCAAYERNAEGSWTVLRANKILERGKVWREVVPGDDLAKLRDGPFLSRLLDAAADCLTPRALTHRSSYVQSLQHHDEPSRHRLVEARTIIA
jgi:hypothetical protein